MSIKRAGTPLLLWMVEKRGNKRRENMCRQWCDSFCGDSISFADDDGARHQPFVVGLEGFLPPRDVDRAGGHAVVVMEGREAQ